MLLRQHGSVLQCVAVCCIVLQCVAVCCSVLQCVAVCCSFIASWCPGQAEDPDRSLSISYVWTHIYIYICICIYVYEHAATQLEPPQMWDSKRICQKICWRHIESEHGNSRRDRGSSEAGTLTVRLGRQVWQNFLERQICRIVIWFLIHNLGLWILQSHMKYMVGFDQELAPHNAILEFFRFHPHS